MAKKLDAFPGDSPEDSGPRRYPWSDWTDGSVWEIRRGDDYDVETENMRVNLHMKADALTIKVRTSKVGDDHGEGLIFQFLDPDAKELKQLFDQADKAEVDAAMEVLYA